jgi:hypothetical protein
MFSPEGWSALGTGLTVLGRQYQEHCRGLPDLPRPLIGVRWKGEAERAAILAKFDEAQRVYDAENSGLVAAERAWWNCSRPSRMLKMRF